MNEYLSGEPITDENREDAERALVLSASLMEKSLVAAMTEAGPGFSQWFIDEHKEALAGMEAASVVIREWKDFLEVRV